MDEGEGTVRQPQDGAEPVYGPAYRSNLEAGQKGTQAPRAAVVEGPAPPYTAPYPPYPSDVPYDLPMSVPMAGAMAYLVVPAVFFLLLPPYRSHASLRFHSWQAIFYFLMATALREVEEILASMLPSAAASLLGGLLFLALFAGWLVVVVKALQGERWHLPLVGTFAEQVARTSSLQP